MLKSDNPASLKKKVIQQVVAIAVLSVAITGGLVLIFDSNAVQSLFNLHDKLGDNSFIPGLANIFLLALIAAFLSVFMANILIKRMFKHNDELTIDEINSEIINEPEIVVHTAENLIDHNDVTELKASLETEKLFNSLMLSVLNGNTAEAKGNPEAILAKLADFCAGDFAAYYQLNEANNAYMKLFARDTNPELARHSSKVEVLNPELYHWMFECLKTGDVFVFRTAMLESLIEKAQQAQDDAKAWMQYKAQETAEYKLCKHEAWQLIMCLPCLNNGIVIGLFLLGFENSLLPVSQEMKERLGTISTALGSRMACPASEQQQNESVNNLEMITSNLSDAIVTVDNEGVITFANPAVYKLSGYALNKVVGQTFKDAFLFISSESRLPIADPLRQLHDIGINYTFPVDTLLLAPNEREIPVGGTGAIIRDLPGTEKSFVFLIRDTTCQINAEAEQIKDQRMEAVSSLSAGLAHDFNNLLTAILGNISLVLDDLPPDSEQAQFLKAAEECTLKGKDITNRLLTFAKSSPISDISTDIMTVLEKIATDLVAGTKVHLKLDIDSELPALNMSVINFEKVINNLISNALDAMVSGGELLVSTELFDKQDDNELPLMPGKYICIRIKDTGEGISRENQSRIFVPYFTTRAGKSGLGLPSAYSIIKKHNGYIRIDSLEGKGTVCNVYIPVAEASAPFAADPEVILSKDANIVLVLDEDDMLGNLLIKTLAKMGLQVEKTSDPDELIVMFERNYQNGIPADLILLDLNIPAEKDISTLAKQIRQKDKKVKIVAYSNLLKLDDLAEYQKLGFDDILLRPFNITDLKNMINRNLQL